MEAVEKLIVLFAEAKKPVGQLVMSGVNTLFAAGRAQEGQAMFTKYFKKYPDDPMLQAFVQQLMAQAPPAMQPLSPTVPMGPGADSNGGLWVPGQSSPEASPASSGGSKLWLPGME